LIDGEARRQQCSPLLPTTQPHDSPGWPPSPLPLPLPPAPAGCASAGAGAPTRPSSAFAGAGTIRRRWMDRSMDETLCVRSPLDTLSEPTPSDGRGPLQYGRRRAKAAIIRRADRPCQTEAKCVRSKPLSSAGGHRTPPSSSDRSLRSALAFRALDFFLSDQLPSMTWIDDGPKT